MVQRTLRTCKIIRFVESSKLSKPKYSRFFPIYSIYNIKKKGGMVRLITYRRTLALLPTPTPCFVTMPACFLVRKPVQLAFDCLHSQITIYQYFFKKKNQNKKNSVFNSIVALEGNGRRGSQIMGRV